MTFRAWRARVSMGKGPLRFGRRERHQAASRQRRRRKASALFWLLAVRRPLVRFGSGVLAPAKSQAPQRSRAHHHDDRAVSACCVLDDCSNRPQTAPSTRERVFPIAACAIRKHRFTFANHAPSSNLRLITLRFDSRTRCAWRRAALNSIARRHAAAPSPTPADTFLAASRTRTRTRSR